MDVLIKYPSSWILPEDSPYVRLTNRPPAYKQHGFDRQFDSTTVFYDCVSLKDAAVVVLQGPPLWNLHAQLRRLRINAPSHPEGLTYWIREYDRHTQIWIAIRHPIESLQLTSDLGHVQVPLSADCNEFFRGMRVLLTLNKNNKPDWICDWIRFHRDIHGANSVLLYDNSSTIYDLKELLARLRTLLRVDRLCIVSWPFKFGPQGYQGVWDSDFCQYGALENARWRFLQKARSVLSCDIDELVLTRDWSVFELAESNGYISFFGKWIVGLAPEPSGALQRQAPNRRTVRHADFRHALNFKSERRRDGLVHDSRCPSKWAVVPSRCPNTAQWKVHQVTVMNTGEVDTSIACYRHFREINTHWKYCRSLRDRFDAQRHYVDE